MPNPILYHNPRCSKSRQALAYLDEQNIDIDIIEYLKIVPKLDEIKTLYKALKENNAINSAIEMIRPKEAEFSAAGLNKSASDEEILKAIAEYPKLLERPILLKNGLAAIGRPLANIEALVND